jgi:hypothetical protein
MRILLIVQPDRRDFYDYLERDTENEYLLLWYESRSNLSTTANNAQFFKEVYYWQQFLTPHHLLKRIKPDKIVFFEIIDQRQIALLVAANDRKITTFYLEHGAAADKGTAIERANTPGYFKKKRIPYLLKRFTTALPQAFWTKVFYYSSFSGFASLKSRCKYWLLPFVMLWFPPNKALAKLIFKERIPLYSIVFNKNNFQSLFLYTGLREESALFTGVPHFDKYYRSSIKEKNQIVYIEHPLLEEGLLEWTRVHHKMIADKLFAFAVERKIKTIVKLHPRSNKANWVEYNYQSPYFEIVQEGDYTREYLESRLILGFSSTLITGLLCARKNVVLLGWNPVPRVFGYDFFQTGLCHKSLNPDDLFSKYDYWIDKNLCEQNSEQYLSFLEQFNFPFDGQATKRVFEAINNL